MGESVVITAGHRQVRISSPDRVVFPQLGVTKLELVQYYLQVADGALRGVRDRPMVLKRYPQGIDEEPFFQKRVPANRPDWVRTATLRYRSGTSAQEAVLDEPAALAWAVNLGCVDLNPHPVRTGDLAHPDELRIDLDPMPGVDWPQVLRVALVAREVLAEHHLTSWPKTSGSKGFHLYCRLNPGWTYPQARTAAYAVAREVHRRVPDLATAQWWKQERGSAVFLDFNQNAMDRTTASAYSVRALADARVSTPLSWAEVPGCDPAAFTLRTVPRRLAEQPDPWAAIDAHPGDLDELLTLAEHFEPLADASERPEATALIEVARARTRAEALAGLDRWRQRHPEVAVLLRPADVLVDGMRGSSTVWFRVRINLSQVPAQLRPPQAALEVDYDPWANRRGRRSRGEPSAEMPQE